MTDRVLDVRTYGKRAKSSLGQRHSRHIPAHKTLLRWQARRAVACKTKKESRADLLETVVPIRLQSSEPPSTESMISPMPRRHNHNWASGGSFVIRPAVPTEFEMYARRLGLSERTYVSSRELRAWCKRNRHRCYVPEWLLLEWGLPVEPTLSE